MDLSSSTAKQMIVSNQRTDVYASLRRILGLLPPRGYLSVAPPLESHPFLPRITIIPNNYRGIPPTIEKP